MYIEFSEPDHQLDHSITVTSLYICAVCVWHIIIV